MNGEVIREPKHVTLLTNAVDGAPVCSIHEWYGHNNERACPLYTVALGGVVFDGVLPEDLVRAAFKILNAVHEHVPEEVMERMAKQELEGFV